MFPIPLSMSVGVGNNHPSKSKSITQIGIFVFEILISSIFSASTSFVTVVVLMSLPASCWFCCPTNCCVFSLPARTLAFTEGPPLLEKGLRKDGIVAHPTRRLLIRRLAIRFFMYHPRRSYGCFRFLTHPDAKTSCQSPHAHRY